MDDMSMHAAHPFANVANVRQCRYSGTLADSRMARPQAPANAGRGYGGYIGEGRIGGLADENLPFLAVKIPPSLAVTEPHRQPHFSRFGLKREDREAGRARP